MMRTITTQKLFTGDHWLHNCMLVIEEGLIKAVESFTGEPEHELIVPAFIDLQIYGAGGRLFSVYPHADSLELLYQSCLKGGTQYFLPTVATNSPEVISSCIKAVRSFWEKGGKGCLGLHLEGPWLNPIRKGAHLAEFMHAPTVSEVESLLEEGKDVIKIITLSPECCSREVIKLLRANDIKISAGHSDATYEQALQGFDQGIQLATHLFNAMSPFQHRAPGLAGAILNHSTVMASIIPDGYHVDWVALKLAQRLMWDRLFVITDAVTDTQEGPYQHYPAGDRYEAGGVLSGSALTMLKACNNLIQHAGLDKAEALRLCSLYPAKAIGMENSLGRLDPGFQASFISVREFPNGFELNNIE